MRNQFLDGILEGPLLAADSIGQRNTLFKSLSRCLVV